MGENPGVNRFENDAGIAARPLFVMGDRFFDLPFLVEEENFGSELPVHAPVVEGQAANAAENGYEEETQVRKSLQRLGPIGADFFLALQNPRGFSGNMHDDWRLHLEIVRVMGEDGVQIVRIPVANPLLGAALGLVRFEHDTSPSRTLAAGGLGTFPPAAHSGPRGNS